MIEPNLANAVLLQYETPLPDDFNAKSIKERVSELAPAFDRMAGILVKFYGLNERPEAPLNEYVSTYIWRNPVALREFLEGDRFGNYSEAFARPNARIWLPHDISGDFEEIQQTRFLLKQTFGIPRKTSVGKFLGTWQNRPLLPSAIVRVIGFDSATWELVELTALRERPDLNNTINGHLYTIVHISKPSER